MSNDAVASLPSNLQDEWGEGARREDEAREMSFGSYNGRARGRSPNCAVEGEQRAQEEHG